MSATFASKLRARPEDVVMVEPEASALRVRVEVPELWETVRVLVAPGEPVAGVKLRVLEELLPEVEMHQDFVVKFRGWEILDEATSLEENGIVDGSILLLTNRRRRPVR